ncbi:MAG: hypothetical protein N2109_04895 [Fimbriimonadales bacterium]|nr:hypothetical protein [Fimbriimonadales bacterium]
MSSTWPWVAVAAAALACGLRVRQKESAPPGNDWLLAVPFVLALAASFLPGPWEQWPLFVRGMVSGAFLGAMAAWLLPNGVQAPSHLAAVLGLSSVAAVPAHFLEGADPSRSAHLQLGVIVGLGLAALFASGRRAEVSGAGATAVAATGFLSADALGRFRLESVQDAEASASVSLLLPSIGLVLGIAATAAWIVAGLLERWAPRAVAAGTGWVLSLSLGLLALHRYFGLPKLAWVFGLSAAVGGAWWLLGRVREADAPWASLAGAALSLALGGVAFAEERGLGLALALAGLSFGMALGGRSVLCLGPLVAVAVLRLLREMADGLRTIDLLNQQTAMGLLAGLLLLALAGCVAAETTQGRSRFGGALGWAMALKALFLATASALGPRAAMAMVLGAGVGLCLPTTKRFLGDRLAGLGMVAAGSVAAAFGWLTALFEQGSRDERLRWLGLAAAVGVLAAALIAASAPAAREEGS